jgi:GMC oxidoreductase
MEKKKIVIIGCGTYGSYLLKRLLDQFDAQFDITVIEIGNKNIKTESEIGLDSRSLLSQAPKSGRYFGLGGTSTRWGGQILFFDKRDNPSNDADWAQIIRINDTYKNKVLDHVFEKNVPSKVFKDDTGNVKLGVWLKYTSRNLFKKINTGKYKNVTIVEQHRVTDFELIGDSIKSVTCSNQLGNSQKIEADYFYLTAGAIESCRLLLNLNAKYAFLNSADLGRNFGDHLSVELFKITATKPILQGIDFTPIFHKGHLITKRLIVYSKAGRIGYIHPIFNKDVKVFASIKNMLFGKQKTLFDLKSIFFEFGFLIKMFFKVFFFNKLHVHKSDWRLQLDIEQEYPNHNCLSIHHDLDQYNQGIVNIDWQISKEDKATIEEMKIKAIEILASNGIEFTTTYKPNIATHKIEDVYHPVGFIKMGSDKNAILDFDGKVNGITNLFHFSTAMFSSAKSINPTAAAFCHIEYHLSLLKS